MASLLERAAPYAGDVIHHQIQLRYQRMTTIADYRPEAANRAR